MISLGEGIKDEVATSDKVSFSVHSVLTLEMTEASLLGNPRILDDAYGKLWLLDRNKVFAFDSQTGRFSSMINRRGEGAENYIYIADCVPTPDGKVYLLDGAKHAFCVYTPEGDWVDGWRNDSIVSFAPIDNGGWIAFNSQQDTCMYDLCLYDADWQFLRGDRKRTAQLNFNGLIPEYSFLRMNNRAYVELSDTLYAVQGDGTLHAEFWLDEGTLKMPVSDKFDLNKENSRDAYIWRDYLCCSDNFCFISYMYQQKRYFDVWDIRSNQLRFRNVMSKPDDPFGLPVKVGDVEVRGWPFYSKDGLFYCVLDEASSAEVLQIEAECNPCVVRLTVE